jgi:hypothetical protein
VDLSEVGLIGDKEAVQFADLLKNEAVIISGLSLARTHIEERGSHTLLEAVKKNKTLISLNLKGARNYSLDIAHCGINIFCEQEYESVRRTSKTLQIGS